MALLRAVQRMPSTGNSTLACEMGVYGVLPMLNYRALSWFYGDITEFGRQTVVHELLVLAATLCRAMLRRLFRYPRSFLYAALFDIKYLAESIVLGGQGLSGENSNVESGLNAH